MFISSVVKSNEKMHLFEGKFDVDLCKIIDRLQNGCEIYGRSI